MPTCPGTSIAWNFTGQVSHKSVNTSTTPWTYGTGPDVKNLDITVFAGYCHNNPPDTSHVFPWTSIQWQIDSVIQTDTSGNWSWTKTDTDLQQVAFCVGVYINNPNYVSGGTGVDGTGTPIAWKFKKDPTVLQYSCTNIYDVSSHSAHFASSQTQSSGGGIPTVLNPIPDGSMITFFCGLDGGGFTPQNYHNYLRPVANSADSTRAPILMLASKSGQWYNVTGVYFTNGGTMSAGDSQGGSSGSVSLVTVGANSSYVLPDTVDWYYLSGLTLASNPLNGTNVPTGALVTPYHEPPSNCTDEANAIVGHSNTGWQIYPTTTYYPTTGQALVTDRLIPIGQILNMGDFTTTSTTDLWRSAAVFKNHVVYVWVNHSGALKAVVHRGMLKHTTDRLGLGTIQTLAASGASTCGILALPSGTFMIKSDAGNFISHDLGNSFQAIASGQPTLVGPVMGGDIGMGMAVGVHVTGGPTTFTPVVNKYQDGRGNITPGSLSGVTGTQYCGAIYLRQGWHIFAGNRIIRPASWPITTADVTAAYAISGLSGTAVGVARAQASTLVALDYNSTTKKCKGAWSHDRGQHWQNASAVTTSIPDLDLPPALVSLPGGSVAAIWEINDIPAFSISFDAGKTWT